MSDLREVLNECRDKARSLSGGALIEAIIADGRIGVLPTRSELANLESEYGTCMRLNEINSMIAAGYAREDDEVK